MTEERGREFFGENPKMILRGTLKEFLPTPLACRY